MTSLAGLGSHDPRSVLSCSLTYGSFFLLLSEIGSENGTCPLHILELLGVFQGSVKVELRFIELFDKIGGLITGRLQFILLSQVTCS